MRACAEEQTLAVVRVLIASHPLDALKRNAQDITVRYYLNKPVVPTVPIDGLHPVAPRARTKYQSCPQISR